VFWIVAVTALPLAGVSVMLVPNGLRAADGLSKGERVARLDLFGVSALTRSCSVRSSAYLMLTIRRSLYCSAHLRHHIWDGGRLGVRPSHRTARSRCLAHWCLPLLGDAHPDRARGGVCPNRLSFFAIADITARPPRTWFYKNFTLLFFVAMVPSCGSCACYLRSLSNTPQRGGRS
jgi:hypothetical protein